VAVPVPMPAALSVVMPAEPFAGEPPYVLDTGDRLRIVVLTPAAASPSR